MIWVRNEGQFHPEIKAVAKADAMASATEVCIKHGTIAAALLVALGDAQ